METDFEKIVTFNSHYGAVLFARKFPGKCKIRPVPRRLSSSCGDCIYTGAEIALGEIIENADTDYAEAVYDADTLEVLHIF